ncbi:levodione reductase [Aspergillus lentulus]|uniref:Levodione reductase n=1 Tax=Aspergillus lentulus TaxID=293939 RepID=A0AAN4TCT1_ASPLE|nr:levodione reductase [Aspergillus lentulus]
MAENIVLPSLKGKCIIITGGARGIGAAGARLLASQGAKLAIFDIRDDLGYTVAKEISSTSAAQAKYYPVDVSKKADISDAVSSAVRYLGGVHCFLHAAGIGHQSPCEDLTEDEVNRMVDVNLKGTIYANQAVFPYMKKSGGSILNVGSDTGLDTFPGLAHYSASKGAVHSFTRTIAKEWGSYNIRVNALLPAAWTDLVEEHMSKMSPDESHQLDKYCLVVSVSVGSQAT